MSPLEQARAQIVADLEGTQQVWRKKPALLRVALLLVPALAVVVAAWAVLDAGRSWSSVPVLTASLASLLALLSTTMAPSKPAASERLSQVATVVAVVAFIAEATRMQDVPDIHMGLDCFAYVFAFAVASAVVTGVGLRASRLPLRLWHRIGLATAATLGACSALWHHCPSVEVLHIAVAHTLGPAALIAAVVVVVGRVQR